MIAAAPQRADNLVRIYLDHFVNPHVITPPDQFDITTVQVMFISFVVLSIADYLVRCTVRSALHQIQRYQHRHLYGVAF
jgi:hypothetical protein